MPTAEESAQMNEANCVISLTQHFRSDNRHSARKCVYFFHIMSRHHNRSIPRECGQLTYQLDCLGSVARKQLTVAQASLFENGSTPLENSSINTTGKSPISAIAKLNFRWFPPDRLVASCSALFSKPAAARRALMSACSNLRGTPFRRPYNQRCWLTSERQPSEC